MWSKTASDWPRDALIGIGPVEAGLYSENYQVNGEMYLEMGCLYGDLQPHKLGVVEICPHPHAKLSF